MEGMLRIEFAPADLAGLRFAHSPMVEVVTSALVLTRPDATWLYDSWRASVRPRLTGVETFLAVVSGPTCYVPDFLTPVPPVARPTLTDELRAVAATPLDQVAAEVHAGWTGHDAPPQIGRFTTDPAGSLVSLIGQIRRYFDLALGPLWPRLRALADAEIAARARTATERGPRALVDGLHPRLDWDGSALRMRYDNKTRHWGLDGHQLALLPTGFAGPSVYFMTESAVGRAVWYAPRGYGRLWEPTGPNDALAALLGPTRAAVLSLLAAPHSTGEVAEALKLAPATASHHLTTLRDAGLVVGERVGRRLRYLRTGLGDDIVSTSPK
jgi:biotin operon repressor